MVCCSIELEVILHADNNEKYTHCYNQGICKSSDVKFDVQRVDNMLDCKLKYTTIMLQ